MPQRFTPTVLERLIKLLTEARDQALAVERSFACDIDRARPEHRPSARNLLHYLGLRQQDIRDLQRDLAVLGLSSLGRGEAHTLAGLDAVLAAVHRLADRPMSRPAEAKLPVDFQSGPEMLARHTEALLGPRPEARAVRIMVTMPGEAATNYGLVEDLVTAGMDVMRINCAHDDVAAWSGMVENLRRASRETGRPCRVLTDLGGPKLRTGALEPGHRVVHVRPRRDDRGTVISPARVWLTPAEVRDVPVGAPDAVLRMDGGVLSEARAGDVLRVVDARGKKRELRVTGTMGPSIWAALSETAYFETGSPVQLRRGGTVVASGAVGLLPALRRPIVLGVNDRLRLTADEQPGHPARFAADGAIESPATVPCTLPQVIRDVRVGERVFFDDGKIGGVVRGAEGDSLDIEITQARQGRAELHADKGINLPDSDLHLPGLTERDLVDLDFAVQHADIVGLSFVRSPSDVELLEQHLAARRGEALGVLLKIETGKGFECLPKLLLAGMRSRSVGVMVARGDLAVEVGFERLAEAQEEILWFCEAAHVPVVWATQVLESLAKKGVPSRAEVTDAAMSGRAECVMLNKGPHVVEAVYFLDNVLQRMQAHQEKKRAMLRKLSVSRLR